MRAFLDTTFDSTQLNIVGTVLDEWIDERSLSKDDPDTALAAAILINLFREGNTTIPELKKAAEKHRGLSELG